MKLVIADKKDSKINEIDLLKDKLNFKKIIEIIFPSDEKIINLYKYAKLFIFPSLYEGFNLSPFETIACGCPTITSNLPVLKEILRNSITCFNPYSINILLNNYGK